VRDFSLDGGRRFLPNMIGLQYLIRGVLDPDRVVVMFDLNKGVRRPVKTSPGTSEEIPDYLFMVYMEKFSV
jgi:hypothetical protein